MTPQRNMLHDSLKEALRCTSEEDYLRTKRALLGYLKGIHPEMMAPKGGRLRVLQKMAEAEGITLQEKIEDVALLAYVLERSWAGLSKDRVVQAIAEADISEDDRAILTKVFRDLMG